MTSRRGPLARLRHALGSRIAAFDTSLLEAASLPDSEARLSRIAETARTLATQINTASQEVQAARANADDRIEANVDLLNRTLKQISELNTNIRATYVGTRDPSALIDQRQQLIDSIASVIPIREVTRNDGQITPVHGTKQFGYRIVKPPRF